MEQSAEMTLNVYPHRRVGENASRSDGIKHCRNALMQAAG